MDAGEKRAQDIGGMHGNTLPLQLAKIKEVLEGDIMDEGCCLEGKEVAADEGVQHIDDLSDADVRRLLHQLLKGAPEASENLLPHPLATCDKLDLPNRSFLTSIILHTERRCLYCECCQKFCNAQSCMTPWRSPNVKGASSQHRQS